LSHIDTTSFQKLCQALAQLVGLAQHLPTNPWLAANTMAVDYNCLRQQGDQNRMARQIEKTYITQCDAKI
jgi:hypothetical protein